MMNKLRWVMDDGFWDLDLSTPTTLDGLARPISGETLLPLGLSRGAKLSRPKQIDFMQRFMAAPFVPSYDHAHGFSLQRVLSFPFGGEHIFATMLGQFNLQKFVSSIKESGLIQSPESSWMQSIGKHLHDKSLYALGFCSELFLTPNDILLLSVEGSGDKPTTRKKAVYHHKFSDHNLMAEAVLPGLFVDKSGSSWDVPLSMAIDLASVGFDSGLSYRLSMHHNSGSPKPFDGGDEVTKVPANLLPGFCAKTAFSFNKSIDVWRSEANKLKMLQPYDIFMSSSHVSVSGIIGAVMTASHGDNYIRAQIANDSSHYEGLSLHSKASKLAFLADSFVSASFTAQYGNFQKLVLDLTRVHARLDFPSGSKFLLGAKRITQNLLESQKPNMDTIQAICPNATISLQQQLVGPFSIRVDSGVEVEFKNRDWKINTVQPVFAIEYALHVLGSAKAVAWYSPKQKEFMVELRFFET